MTDKPTPITEDVLARIRAYPSMFTPPPMVAALLAALDEARARAADAELSLAVYDAGGDSEYWLRYPAAGQHRERGE